MDIPESKKDNTPKPSNRPLDDMNKAYQEAKPILSRLLERFLIASWNMFMKVLVSIGVMPIFRKAPWLFILLAFLLLAVLTPLGVYFIASAFVGYNGENVENDFLQNVERKPYFNSDEDEKEALQGEAMLQVYEAGHSMEDARKVYDAIGEVYEMKKAKSDNIEITK